MAVVLGVGRPPVPGSVGTTEPSPLSGSTPSFGMAQCWASMTLSTSRWTRVARRRLLRQKGRAASYAVTLPAL